MVRRTMQGIILSKDRAAQCQLIIESILLNLDWFDNISVVYTTSNDEYERGYEICKNKFPSITFIKQDNYKDDIMSLVNESYNYTTFFTDDDIVYQNRNGDKSDVLDILESDNIGCFSLRLGLNTTIQDPYNNIPTICPKELFGFEDMIFWDWKSVPNYMNFGYPCSVDGHIFRTGQLKEILLQCNFNNPNQQEIAMNNLRNCVPSMMASFKHSCVVNTPINRVQETCSNRNGETFGKNVKDINDNYVSGNYLDFNSIDFSAIVGCHQELDIKWNTM